MDRPARPRRPHGWVEASLLEDGKAGALVQLATDRAQILDLEVFQDFASCLARQVLMRAPRSVAELADQEWIRGGPSAGWALDQLGRQLQAGLGLVRSCRFEVRDGWVHSFVPPDHDAIVLIAVECKGRSPLARVGLNALARQILEESAWEVVMGEDGPEEHFDPLVVVDRPWALDHRTTVQAEMERILGGPWRLAGYAAYRGSCLRRGEDRH